jgi:hypothetical protein
VRGGGPETKNQNILMVPERETMINKLTENRKKQILRILLDFSVL